MVKHRWSKLTDDQHKKLVDKIGTIKTIQDEKEARIEAKYISNFLFVLEAMGFICALEAWNYRDEIRKICRKRGMEWQFI